MPKQDKVMEKLDQLVRELTANTIETKNIVNRLDKLNGSISNHESRLQAIERASDLTASAIALIQKQITSEEQDERAKEQVVRDRLWVWVDRILVGVASAILVLIFTHAEAIMRLFS